MICNCCGYPSDNVKNGWCGWCREAKKRDPKLTKEAVKKKVVADRQKKGFKAASAYKGKRSRKKG